MRIETPSGRNISVVHLLRYTILNRSLVPYERLDSRPLASIDILGRVGDGGKRLSETKTI